MKKLILLSVASLSIYTSVTAPSFATSEIIPNPKQMICDIRLPIEEQIKFGCIIDID